VSIRLTVVGIGHSLEECEVACCVPERTLGHPAGVDGELHACVRATVAHYPDALLSGWLKPAWLDAA